MFGRLKPERFLIITNLYVIDYQYINNIYQHYIIDIQYINKFFKLTT